VQFEELVSLDPDTLNSLSPIGVIFLFKYPTGEAQKSDKAQDGTFDFDALDAGNAQAGEGGKGDVWFAAQTIQNACGTQALLSVLLNKGKEEGVEIGGPLGEFRDFTTGFPADVSRLTSWSSSSRRDSWWSRAIVLTDRHSSKAKRSRTAT